MRATAEGCSERQRQLGRLARWPGMPQGLRWQQVILLSLEEEVPGNRKDEQCMAPGPARRVQGYLFTSLGLDPAAYSPLNGVTSAPLCFCAYLRELSPLVKPWPSAASHPSQVSLLPAGSSAPSPALGLPRGPWSQLAARRPAPSLVCLWHILAASV